jgi:hypothetical protein
VVETVALMVFPTASVLMEFKECPSSGLYGLANDLRTLGLIAKGILEPRCVRELLAR